MEVSGKICLHETDAALYQEKEGTYIMDNFTFYAPTYFVFGKDTENETGKYVKKFGGSRVLLHYGGGSAVRSGLLDRVKKSLDKEGLAYVELEA